MKPSKIKALLVEKEISQVSIARQIGVPQSNINQVITGVRTSRRIRQAIAQALGMPVEQLWPEKSSKKAA